MKTGTAVLLLGIVGGIGALFATKPGAAQIEDHVAGMIMSDIQSTGASDLASGLLLLACKSSINDCVGLVRSTMDVRTEDKVLWQNVFIQSGQTELRCLAILNQLRCSDD